jgi:MFS family permease
VAVAVGVVLADSSIVTLALPDILQHYRVDIPSVARVLTAYNIALAICAAPAALLARRWPRAVLTAGGILFAAGSVLCGLAPTFNELVAARIGQAIGGAAIAGAALAAIPAALWTTAGVIGASVGPALGGIVTQLAGWEWIFLIQTPVALVALAGGQARRDSNPVRRPPVRPMIAGALVASALTAALFLLVVLLVDAWRLEPAAAGLVVTVIPVAAIAGRRLRASPTAGAIAIAGGLGALALVPHAGAVWTVPPQILIGAGIGLTVGPLTMRVIAGPGSHVAAGGFALSARHLGVVIGLVLLAPLFTTDLTRARDHALQSGAAIVLDANIPITGKLQLVQDVLRIVDASGERIPDISPAFRGRTGPEWAAVHSALQDQLERAATHAFSRSFAVAAVLALLAALVAFQRAGRDIALSALAGGALIGLHLLLGGSSYKPTPVANPCVTRPWRNSSSASGVAQQIVLSALDGSACKLRVSREALVLAMRSRVALHDFAVAHHLSDAEVATAVRDGLKRSVADAQHAGLLGSLEVFLLDAAIDRIPVGSLLGALQQVPLQW